MRKGLMSVSGLKPDQYQALKDRDTAYRIYKMARQKFNRQEKGMQYISIVDIHHYSFITSLSFIAHHDIYPSFLRSNYASLIYCIHTYT